MPETQGTELQETQNTDLQEYENAVEQLAQTKSDFIFPNSSPEHAAIVLRAMFRHSTKEVRMYDHSLNGDISDKCVSTIEAMAEFIKDGTKKLKIVIRDDSAYPDARIFQMLSQSIPKNPNIDIRKASAEFQKEIINIYNKDINFAVGDSTSFRMEKTDGGTQTAVQREAICSFNRPSYAKQLASVFDKHFLSCSRVQLS